MSFRSSGGSPVRNCSCCMVDMSVWRRNPNARNAQFIPTVHGKVSNHDDDQHDRIWPKRRGVAGGSVTAELRSVNHRFCEIVVRLPRVMSSLEDEFKRTIQQHCARGRIELSVSLSGGKETGKQLSLDHALARQYHSLLRDLKKKLRLSGSIDVAMLTGYRALFRSAIGRLTTNRSFGRPNKLSKRRFRHSIRCAAAKALFWQKI